MHTDYWQQRWDNGQTGWHRDDVMPLLRQYWPHLQLPADAPVLVPLCGKTLDMSWLAAQGHAVLGIELAQAAIDAFLSEHNLSAVLQTDADGLHHRAGAIDVLRADIFNVRPSTFAHYHGIYDRAALIALPAAMRQRYVKHVYGALPRGCKGLLITLDYPQQQKHGPPFAVPEAEVNALFAADWDVQLLLDKDILHSQPAFMAEGVTALHTAVYLLHKR